MSIKAIDPWVNVDMLDMRRCLEEAHKLDLREGVLEKFVRENARKLFFGERSPRA